MSHQSTYIGTAEYWKDRALRAEQKILDTKPPEYPTIPEVAYIAHNAVIEAMSPKSTLGTGSDKSGPGEWYTKDIKLNKYYHLLRVASHGERALHTELGLLDDGESCREHLIRVICRAAMQLVIMGRNKQTGGS